MSANPILLSLRRGDLAEAWYRGAYCVVRDGEPVEEAGDPQQILCLRSAAKPFQTLAHLQSGAAERFGVPPSALALLTASHGGEDLHVDGVAALLALGGLEPHQLQCGSHPPLHRPSAARLRSAGTEPTALHNNCSGKHAGMLLAGRAEQRSLDDYLAPDHPHQRRIAAVLAECAGLEPERLHIAVDGCSAPTFSLPLRHAALAWGTWATAVRDGRGGFGTAARRLFEAIIRHPHHFAGHQRFDTDLILATTGRVVAKIGAQGFYGAAVPSAGLGIALHIDDGDWNVSERVIAQILVRHGALREDETAALTRYLDPVRRNHAGRIVGTITCDF